MTSEHQLFEEHFFGRYSFLAGDEAKRKEAEIALSHLEHYSEDFSVIETYLSELKSIYLPAHHGAYEFAKALIRVATGCNRLRCYYSRGARCTCGRPLEISS